MAINRIVGATLVRNETGRYLEISLVNMLSLCDLVVVLDDYSTDDTFKTCVTLVGGGGFVRLRGSQALQKGFWGQDETSARAELWNLAAEAAGPGGWVYVADADHELCGVSRADMQTLAASDLVTAWAWPLYDCWDGDTQHRVDGFWQAWQHPRPWMAQVPADPAFQPVWPQRGLHCGHFPHNLPLVPGVAPGFIKHLGYITLADRQAKAAKYLACA